MKTKAQPGSRKNCPFKPLNANFGSRIFLGPKIGWVHRGRPKIHKQRDKNYKCNVVHCQRYIINGTKPVRFVYLYIEYLCTCVHTCVHMWCTHMWCTHMWCTHMCAHVVHAHVCTCVHMCAGLARGLKSGIPKLQLFMVHSRRLGVLANLESDKHTGKPGAFAMCLGRIQRTQPAEHASRITVA